MATRIGIELSPVACRIIEIDAGAARPGDVPETRVRSYAVLEMGSGEMTAHLNSLRRRRAAVVVWGVKSDHRQVIVGQRGYDKMRAEALESAGQAAVETDGMLSDIAPAGTVQEGATRRPVLLAMAASRGISTAVQPLLLAGLRLRSVVTPADALASLARTRRAFSPPETIEAYVVLEETATAVALVRDGGLIAARELAWGFLEHARADRQSRPREDIAARLSEELTAFFAEIGAEPGSVRQVSICGGLPELRSMTVQLMERLDIEVETLDSLFGIDTERLPEPAQDFRDQSAELRLAWAVAADWVAPINLIRQRNRDLTRRTIARAAVVAGVAAGLALGWRIQTSKWWQTTAPVVARVTPAKTTTSATKAVLPPGVPRPPQPNFTAPAPPPAIAMEAPGRGGDVAALAPGSAKPGAAAALPAPAASTAQGARAAVVPPPPLTPKIVVPAAAVPPAAKVAAAPTKPPVSAPVVPAPSSSTTTAASARANTPAPRPPQPIVTPPAPPPAAAKAAPGRGRDTPPASTTPRANAAVVPPPPLTPKIVVPAAAAPPATKVAVAPAKPQVVAPVAPAPSSSATTATSARANTPAPRPPQPIVTPPAPPPAAAKAAPGRSGDMPAASTTPRASAAAVPPPPSPSPSKVAPPSATVPSVATAAAPTKPPVTALVAPTRSSSTPTAASARAIPPAPRAAEAAPRPAPPPPRAPEPAPRVPPPAPRAAEVAPRPVAPPPRAPEPAPRIIPPPAPVAAPPPRATEPALASSESAARAPSTRAAGRQPAASQPSLPLDAVLGTILYSPERKLAIVDGRIVGIGDEVKGAIIVDITQSTVFLRDGQGRSRSLTLGGSVR